MKIQRLLPFLLVSVSITGMAQENLHSAIKDTVNLDEVVVTGTTVKVNRFNVPMAVSVVNSLRISESVESNILPILNGKIPGLFVTERGIMGFGVAGNAAGQISIRGIGGSPTTRVLMLIDGHPQFMGIFGHPLADSYVASDVERVEVIRGPASILYGTNAMGGVVNIITKKQLREGFSANGHLMYGSYNTKKYMASGGYRKNNLSIFASVNHDRTDGHRKNSGFNITNGYIKAGWDINEHFRAATDFGIAGFRATDPGPDTTGAVKGNTIDIVRGYWSLTADNTFEAASGTLKLFYNFGEHNISDGFHSKDANYGFNINEAFRPYPGSTLTAGIDYMKYGGIAENELAMGGRGMIFKDTTLYDAGIYTFIQQRIAERLTLNAGIRYQDHEVYRGEWIPSGGFALNLSRATTWKASAGKGFRSPTIQELYIWNHNPNLSPERIMNYETGISHAFSKEKLKAELTGFIVRGDNLIITVPLKGLQNAGEIRNRGIELSVNSRPSETLDIDLTYSYIDMKSPVYGTPKHHFYLGGSYRLKKFLFTANVQYINDLDSDPSTKISLETYTLLNGRISWKATKFAELFLNGENLLNTAYETIRYYSMPGTTIFGGIKIKL